MNLYVLYDSKLILVLNHLRHKSSYKAKYFLCAHESKQSVV
jgi:hypothetical protein